MSYYVIINEECNAEIEKHSFMEDILKFKINIEEKQVLQGVNHYPRGLITKRFTKDYRLIMQEHLMDGDNIIELQRFISRGDEREYQKIFVSGEKKDLTQKHKKMLKSFLEKQKKLEEISPLPKLSDPELQILLPLGSKTGENDEIIYESSIWLREMNNYKEHRSVIQQSLQNMKPKINSDDRWDTLTIQDEKLVIYFKYFQELNIIFLAAPIMNNKSEIENEINLKYEKILKLSQNSDDINVIIRKSRRSYPRYLIIDQDVWFTLQKSEDASLALSPEESDLLKTIMNPTEKQERYPLFVNGRPGSGKTTVLQYLFTEHLINHYLNENIKRNVNPPLYLTYSKELSERALDTVTGLYRLRSIIQGINTSESEVKTLLKEIFQLYPDFLYSLLTDELKKEFPLNNRIDFRRFREEWSGQLRKNPNAEVRNISVELAWHVIRSYIKGMSQGQGDYMDPVSYKYEVAEDQKTVTQSTYKLVYDEVWERYNESSKSEKFWDDQDLARAVVDSNVTKKSQRSVIFCDESQDFTRIELETIWNLSLFSKRTVPGYMLKNIPIAFAGDPLQTLNPTGFQWSSLKGTFHDRLISVSDASMRYDLKINFTDLEHNYRSTSNIVRFCNLLLLVRGIIFDQPGLRPQKPWFEEEDSPHPIYADINDIVTQSALKKKSDLVIIVPCLTGEEGEYCSKDSFLSNLSIDGTEDIEHYIISPMRAKGMEFSRVVLYKFGDSCARDYPNLLNPLDDNIPHVNIDEAIPLNYFVNSLYVSASRAIKRLFVVDTEEGLKSLWSKFISGRDSSISFDDLISKYTDKSLWKEEGDELHISFLQVNKADVWTEDKDDHLILGNQFLQQGIAEQDIYMLSQAVKAFEAEGDDLKVYEAMAYKSLFNGKFDEAADYFEAIDKYEEAIENYWKSSNFNKIIEIAQNNSQYTERPDYQASLFMKSKKEMEDCTKFFSIIPQLLEISRTNVSIISDEVWNRVIHDFIDSLYIQAENNLENSNMEWTDNYANIKKLFDVFNLHDQISDKKLSLIAYHASSYVDSVTLYGEDVKIKNVPQWIVEAKAKSTKYPDSLYFYSSLEDYESIIEEYESNQSTELKDKDSKIVFNALLKFDDPEKVLRFVQKYPNKQKFLKIIDLLKPNELDILLKLGKSMIRYFISEQNWSDSTKIAKTGLIESNAGKQSHLILKDSYLVELQRSYVRSIASVTPPKTSNNKLFSNNVRDFLVDTIMKQQYINPALFSIVELGAAIEKSCWVRDMLGYYEWFCKDTSPLKVTDEEKNFTQERWVKCKYRQYSLDNVEKLKTNADEFFKKWKQENSWNYKSANDIQDYPSLPPRVEAERFLQYITQQEYKIQCEDENYTINYFEAAKKLEIRNSATSHLVMIFGLNQEVSSEEVTIEVVGHHKWICNNWNMAFELKRFQDNIGVYIKNLVNNEIIFSGVLPL